MSDRHRYGTGCLVGRPNTGKSTLLNALVGRPLAAVGRRPQTTRQPVRGILHRPDAQFVLVDTPGLHRPRSALGERLNAAALNAVGGADVAVACLPADERVGPGDRRLCAQLAETGRPVFAAVTKADLADRPRLAARLVELAELADWAQLVAVSARTGQGVATLADLLVAALPAAPARYPATAVSDTPLPTLVAELVREQASQVTGDRLGGALAVTVDETQRGPDPARPGRELLTVHAVLHVARSGQRDLLLGAGGRQLARINRAAGRRVAAALGIAVSLDLRVRVSPGWSADPRRLRHLGW